MLVVSCYKSIDKLSSRLKEEEEERRTFLVILFAFDFFLYIFISFSISIQGANCTRRVMSNEGTSVDYGDFFNR
jgi:hypothetical protein